MANKGKKIQDDRANILRLEDGLSLIKGVAEGEVVRASSRTSLSY